MTPEKKAALLSLGYRELTPGTGVWAKTIATQLLTYTESSGRLESWFRHYTNGTTELWSGVEVWKHSPNPKSQVEATERLEGAEGEVLSEFNPWRGKWQVGFSFLTPEDRARLITET